MIDDEKGDLLSQMPHLNDNQRTIYKNQVKSLEESGDYLEAANIYQKLVYLSRDILLKWMYQLETARCLGAYRASIDMDGSDNVYGQMGDVQKHYQELENSFKKALNYAPGDKERKKTLDKAEEIGKECANYYRGEISGLYQEDDPDGGCWRQFLELRKNITL